jgi:hypothetical protein
LGWTSIGFSYSLARQCSSADSTAERIATSTELQLASRRGDGSLRPYVTIWVVGVGGELYVRSAYGPDNPWYERATATRLGRIRAGGVELDVEFADDALRSE